MNPTQPSQDKTGKRIFSIDKITHVDIKYKISRKLFIFWKLYLNIFMHRIMRRIDWCKKTVAFQKNYVIYNMQLHNFLTPSF